MTVSLLSSQPAQLSELRRHPRVGVQRRAWCEHRDWTLYLPVADLSLGGMFIQTSTRFAPGEQLLVWISDADPRIVVEVEVVWWSSRRRGVGIGCRVSSFDEGADDYARLVSELHVGGH